jgi:DNA-binding NarL/FixJ family response regulator
MSLEARPYVPRGLREGVMLASPVQNPADVDDLIKTSKVLIVDDEYCMRKLIRSLLMAIGVTNIHDANDGPGGLDAIRVLNPDFVILDWEMPEMTGAEFVRRVRSPATFPCPNVPIIMLTSHGERSHVLEAMRLGVHEFLLKPVSSEALHARMVSVLTKPRAVVKRGTDHVPELRKGSDPKPAADRLPAAQAAVDLSPPHMILVN